MRAFFTIALLAALLGLTGCETFGPEDCATADWYSLGYKRGVSGSDAAASLENYRQICAPMGVAPDERAFAESYDAGLSVYCNPQKAFVAGARNEAYASKYNLCPQETLDAYYSGAQRLGRSVLEIELARDKYYELQQDASAAKKYLKSLRSKQDKETSEAGKNYYDKDIRAAEKDLDRAIARREKAEDRVYRKTRECSQRCSYSSSIYADYSTCSNICR